jgi:hypothetical protein
VTQIEQQINPSMHRYDSSEEGYIPGTAKNAMAL